MKPIIPLNAVTGKPHYKRLPAEYRAGKVWTVDCCDPDNPHTIRLGQPNGRLHYWCESTFFEQFELLEPEQENG